ncbi:DNA-binding protein [Aureimonas sp. Leaf454]|uniref:type II toxin-antitoxin system VapC family toxin n=1 Tax=Aureimonas sp. Leaf454 TaxID=1736381 RepID=UPI0006FA039A|nr:type II toxin-antitoxin system VapC family toxin [Aureimonas sp. Leaf454]KQT47489.1 DNA-binding protein [Aureimonas sp. Leaf454]
MNTFVDANVLLDVSTSDPIWEEWSIAKLREESNRGLVVINSIVYAEFSVGYDTMRQTDELLAEMGIVVQPIPNSVLFSAGKVFQLYRRRGGTRTGVLPDFFIGAHAESAGMTLLTRDTRHDRTYFPGVALITPDQ